MQQEPRPETEQEMAERIRSEFLANLNHDLRTPLNAVIGFAQIIENEMLGKVENPQYLEYARHIQESGQQLLERIEDLFEAGDESDDRLYATERRPVKASQPRKHLAVVE